MDNKRSLLAPALSWGGLRKAAPTPTPARYEALCIVSGWRPRRASFSGESVCSCQDQPWGLTFLLSHVLPREEGLGNTAEHTSSVPFCSTVFWKPLGVLASTGFRRDRSPTQSRTQLSSGPWSALAGWSCRASRIDAQTSAYACRYRPHAG